MKITLEKLKGLKAHIYLSRLFLNAGLVDSSLRKRMERGTPELSPEESKKIAGSIKKLVDILNELTK